MPGPTQDAHLAAELDCLWPEVPETYDHQLVGVPSRRPASDHPYQIAFVQPLQPGDDVVM
jgi:hypothetical protein